MFRNGGQLLVPEGGEVQIEGAIEAGLSQIFAGDGAVIGRVENRYVYPQWFGARGDGIYDDAAALQKAADLAAEAMGRTLFIPDGDYLFLDDVELRSNVESRGLLVKKIEIDEEKTVFSYDTFVPAHYAKHDPQIRFLSDHEEQELKASLFYGIEEGEMAAVRSI